MNNYADYSDGDLKKFLIVDANFSLEDIKCIIEDADIIEQSMKIYGESDEGFEKFLRILNEIVENE